MTRQRFIELATAGLLTLLATNTHAQDANILEATLAEAGQKTAEISTHRMRQILSDGSTFVIDTRTRLEYDAGHIPGARNIDAGPNQIAAVLQLASGDKTKALVLYCNGPFCQASRRLADQLRDAGFSNVQRYQLGIPIWRALGGPTAIELGGFTRVFGQDKTAVFLDARSADEFAKSNLPDTQNAPLDDVLTGKLKKIPLPEDDFNRRVILFGGNSTQARQFADVLSKRPWHNVSYFAGNYDALADALRK